MAHVTLKASMAYGTTARVGYRIRSSDDPWIYFVQQPSYDEFPYTFEENIPPGDYEFEVSTLCPSCSGGKFSDPQIVYLTVY